MLDSLACGMVPAWQAGRDRHVHELGRASGKRNEVSFPLASQRHCERERSNPAATKKHWIASAFALRGDAVVAGAPKKKQLLKASIVRDLVLVVREENCIAASQQLLAMTG
jgi:hypothetical protein